MTATSDKCDLGSLNTQLSCMFMCFTYTIFILKSLSAAIPSVLPH